MAKVSVAVVFGGRSTEHEVSIITALQVMHNLDKSKYHILPIYISKSGRWVLGNEDFLDPRSYKNLELLTQNYPRLSPDFKKNIFSLSSLSLSLSLPKIDIAFPVFHGTFGEDGTIQGLLEVLNLPYVGSGVLGSALGMDKAVQKLVFTAAGLPQVNYVTLYREGSKDIKGLRYPLFVKPANGGSSIGITKVKKAKDLADALDVAFCYDRKVVVEEAAEKFKEINISVLGNSGSDLITSVCEQPVASADILTYQDKYQTGTKGMASAKRLIPAPIKPAATAKIAAMAKLAYTALDCSGLARVDFLVSPDEKTIYINEVNTIPGSLAFYLWEKSGIPFPQLLDRLIELAFERHQDRARNVYIFPTNILANLGETLKGGKLKG